MGPVPEILTVVSNLPHVQMLVLGFTARECPLSVNNINSLVCSPDGRIFALCYDGNVLQLKDTDGDGLEDTASYFFKNDHHEIPASIGMCWGPGGLYIASRGKILRLRDKGDGSGALETVASGWVPPTIAAGSSLDSIGIAVDKQGSIFFGLGADAWSNPYLPDGKGHSGYHLLSERGTIQELSPDWKHRQTVATGLRFTVSLAINDKGDLFCTDQEGATWLANGNPFDELLNIQPGRHYGFPPRHPLYLPGAIDDPSVFDYAPQHQSTCGLHFNDSGFGPAWWEDDALIAGESRGKLWRTKLVKTKAGYVAQNNLIACLDMLTLDALPLPNGDLLVCCHSGKPDWGSGPAGKGKLFKISYTDRTAPQPVFAYAASSSEIRVTFDRPIDPLQFKNLQQQSAIRMGRYVTAGNRFESFHPGYQAVENQLVVPRYRLPVLSAGITSDNRTIVLETIPHAEAVNYAVTVPCAGVREIDVLSDLTGVEAEWKDARGKVQWTGWLPHLDLDVDRALTAPSEEHQQLFRLLKKRGILTLRTQLDLWSMLHPAIQPGGKIGFEYPPETVTVTLKAGAHLKWTSAKAQKVNFDADGEAHATLVGKENQWLPCQVVIPTGGAATKLEATWFTDEDPRPRAFPLRRFLLPWAKPATGQPMELGPRHIPEIAGGDWERGKKLFFSERPGCYKCHEIGGQGGKIGPSLTTLAYRDYASVRKDILEPSAAINPDHLAYNVALKNGDTQTGVILNETPDTLYLGQVTGQILEIPKGNILDTKASKVSLMPEGLLNGLTVPQQKDLFTYLLMPAPKAPK